MSRQGDRGELRGDELLRALVQRAEASDDAALWLRAGQALARSGRAEEAGAACLRARVAGGRPREVAALEDALVPALDAFEVRTLGRRSGLRRLTVPLLHADGLLVVDSGTHLVEWDLVADARRTITRFAAPVDALARCSRTGRLAVAYGLRVVLVDPETGEEELVARGVGQVGSLALQGDIITWIEGLDAITRLDMARHKGVDEAWHVQVTLGALDPSGAIVLGTRIGGHQVHIEHYAAGSETRRTSYETALHASSLDAAGDRAMVGDSVARTLVLLEDGEVVARAPVVSAGQILNYVPSPSGRQALVAVMEPGGGAVISLLDLREGASRVVLRDRIYGASWSPSGRRVALTDDWGKVVILDASSAPGATAREETPSDEEWTRLRTNERFWLARRVGTNVEVRQGRHGYDGQTSTRRCKDEAAAARELARKVREKRAAGYVDG